MILFIQIISVTADNTANNNTFLKEFESICIEKCIAFDHKKNHVQCIAHIMNFMIQKILKYLNAANIKNENSILEDKYNINGIVLKVNKSKINRIFIQLIY